MPKSAIALDKQSYPYAEQWLHIRDLNMDADYQRPVRDRQVDNIAEGFDPTALMLIVVSKRSDGSFHVVDGKTRITALIKMGWGDQKVPCAVISDLTYREEAALFRKLNEDRRDPTVLQLFKAAIEEGDSNALEIKDVLDSQGLKIAYDNAPSCVKAVDALKKIHGTGGPAMLEEVFDICITSWGRDPDSFLGDILKSLGVLLINYPSLLSKTRLVSVLSTQRPRQWIARGQAQKLATPGANELCLAQAMVNLYNIRQRNKLPTLHIATNSKSFWASKNKPRLNAEQRSLVRRLRAEGKTYREIANEYGIALSSVGGYFDENKRKVLSRASRTARQSARASRKKSS